MITLRAADIASERRRIAKDRYGMFWAAHVFEDVLKKQFDKDDDPGLVVKKYLDSIFPLEKRADGTGVDKWQAIEPPVVVSAEVAVFLHHTVLPWAMAANLRASAETKWPDDLARFLARTLVPWLVDRLDDWAAEPVPEPFGYEEVARCLVLLPQAMFGRLLDWSMQFANDLEEKPVWWRVDSTTADLGDVVLALPLGRAIEASQLQLPQANVLRELIEEHDLWHHTVPFIPTDALSRVLWGMSWDDDCDLGELGPLMMGKVICPVS